MKTLYLVETSKVEYDDYSWDETVPEPKVEAICETRELAGEYIENYLQDYMEEGSKIVEEGGSWTIEGEIRISIREFQMFQNKEEF